MSWLARSIANSLNLDGDDDDEDFRAAQKPEQKQPENPESKTDDPSSPSSPSRGAKEDLSELTKTLTRQLWGVASFLAPPPQFGEKSNSGASEADPGPILGIRGDFAEIGGKFRSGISRLSNNINVSEITKMASNLLQLESDDEDEDIVEREGFDSRTKGAVGVTEEVVAFARDIAMHQETWLNFPLPENNGDYVDFDMSDAQQEHALAVEPLVPTLSALRIELCPGYMSESCFWKIYFVLLHPRLDKQDAELLSTPQIMEARALLAHELKNRTTSKPEDLVGPKSLEPVENVSRHEETLSVPSPVLDESEQNEASDLKTDTSTSLPHSVDSDEIKIVNKSVDKDKDADRVKDQPLISGLSNVDGQKEEDDADDWLKEETSEIDGPAGNTVPIENEDDVSFSDLEEDDGDMPVSFRKSNYSSDRESRDWVQLGKSSSYSSRDMDLKNSGNESSNSQGTKEQNDWLDVDDIVVS